MEDRPVPWFDLPPTPDPPVLVHVVGSLGFVHDGTKIFMCLMIPSGGKGGGSDCIMVKQDNSTERSKRFRASPAGIAARERRKEQRERSKM